MHCKVSGVNSTIRREYTLDSGEKFVLEINKGGVIYIHIREMIPFEFLCEALEEVCSIIFERGQTPTININNSTAFLKILAKKAGFRKIPSSRGMSFSVWRHKKTPKK